MAIAEYHPDQVEAVKSVILELAQLLNNYQDDIVLVGGMVPGLLLKNSPQKHIGTIDVDLALNHRKISSRREQDLKHLLLENNYTPDPERPFRFYRRVTIGEREFKVGIDFLAGEYGGTPREDLDQNIIGLKARKIEGLDLVFNNPEKVWLNFPSGSAQPTGININVVNIPLFLVLKGLAMDQRNNEKDAYDLYYCLKNFPGGISALAGEFRKKLDLNHPSIIKAVQAIKRNFYSPQANGPIWIAQVLKEKERETMDFLRRDSFEIVSRFIEMIGIT